MTKEELYLEIAIKATSWGEGADFEFRELIDNNVSLWKAVENYYNGKFPNIDDEDSFVSWRAIQKQVQKDTLQYLKLLKNKQKEVNTASA